MRLKCRRASGVVLALALVGSASLLAAQQPEEMYPAQSEAKAHSILNQVIAALGGEAFLQTRDSDCTGQLAQIGHNGQLNNYVGFHDQWLLPDKDRQELIGKGGNSLVGYLVGINGPVITSKGTVVVLFNGEKGWMRDNKGKISSQPDDMVKEFNDQVHSSMGYVLRSRLNEKGMLVSYAGTDIVELKPVDWVELDDADGHTYRLAVDQFTHLPLKWVVTSHESGTRQENQTTTTYAEYHKVGGVQTPFNITQQQNGRRVAQTFLTGCKINSDLPAELFTPAGLKGH